MFSKISIPPDTITRSVNAARDRGALSVAAVANVAGCTPRHMYKRLDTRIDGDTALSIAADCPDRTVRREARRAIIAFMRGSSRIPPKNPGHHNVAGGAEWKQ